MATFRTTAAAASITLFSFLFCASGYAATNVNQPITKNTTWNISGSPYIVTGSVTVNSGNSTPITLTINPGVEVKFNDSYSYHGSQLYVGSLGSIYAAGNATARINFTSTAVSPQKGDWTGLTFASNRSNMLANCTIEYGGAGGFDTNGIITVATGAALTLRNCTVQKSAANGLYAAESTTLSFSNTAFRQNDLYPVSIPAKQSGTLGAGNNFTNNTGNAVCVRGGDAVSSNITWKNLNVPYLVQGEVGVYGQPSAPVTFTIEPGAVIKFSKEWTGGLTIGVEPDYYASLKAQGNSTAGISFTSDNSTPQAGDWGSITFTPAAVDSIMQYCTVEYGGSGSSGQISINSASPVLRNCTIRKSANTAIYLYNSTSLVENSTISGNAVGISFPAYDAAPTIQYNTIYNNTRGVEASYNPGGIVQTPFTFRNNNVFNNTEYNYYNYFTDYYPFDIRLNWWGNATNPPKLQGLLISEPWLNSSFTQPFNFRSAAVTPKEFTQNGSAATFTASLPASGNWAIDIRNATGTLVRNFTGTGTSIQQNWNGKNNTGAALKDGNYTYSIRATAVSGGQIASAARGQLKLKGVLPIAKINSPLPDMVMQAGGNITISGSANATSGATLQSYVLEYGTGMAPSYWTEISQGSTPVINTTLGIWDTAGKNDPVYSIRLTVTDSNSRTANDTVALRLFNTYGYWADPQAISPNNDTIQEFTTIQGKITLPAAWSINIENATHALVRNFTGSGIAISQVWDGRNNGGSIVPSGNYTYIISATEPDSGVSAAPRNGTIVVDVTPPTAIISYPANGSLVTQQVNITGTATDSNFDHYDLHYGQGLSPVSWNPVFQGYTTVSNDLLGIWNTAVLNDSIYTVRLTAYDAAGNSANNSRSYNVSNVAITDISVSPAMFDPCAGEIVSINYTLDKASNVTISVYDFDNSFVRTLMTNVSRPSGAQTVTWNGRDAGNNTVRDYGYKFTIDAVTAAGSRGVYVPQFGFANHEASGVQVTPAFDPYQSEVCNITYTLPAPVHITWAIHNDTNISWAVVNAIRPAGINSDYADSKMENGTVLTGNLSAAVLGTVSWWDNMIVTGSHRTPLAFSTDMFCIFPVYGDIANMTYSLPSSSAVTAKVYADGDNSTVVATLLNGTVKPAGNHILQWNGTSDSGSVARPGDYSIVIEANQTAGGRVRVRRGNISVR